MYLLQGHKDCLLCYSYVAQKYAVLFYSSHSDLPVTQIRFFSECSSSQILFYPHGYSIDSTLLIEKLSIFHKPLALSQSRHHNECVGLFVDFLFYLYICQISMTVSHCLNHCSFIISLYTWQCNFQYESLRLPYY